MQLLGLKFMKRFVLPVVLISSTVFNTAFARGMIPKTNTYHAEIQAEIQAEINNMFYNLEQAIICYGERLIQMGQLVQKIQKDLTPQDLYYADFVLLDKTITNLINYYSKHMGSLNQKSKWTSDKFLEFIENLCPEYLMYIMNLYGTDKKIFRVIDEQVTLIFNLHKTIQKVVRREMTKNHSIGKVSGWGIIKKPPLLTELGNSVLNTGLEIQALVNNKYTGSEFLEKLEKIFVQYSLVLDGHMKALGDFIKPQLK